MGDVIRLADRRRAAPLAGRAAAAAQPGEVVPIHLGGTAANPLPIRAGWITSNATFFIAISPADGPPLT